MKYIAKVSVSLSILTKCRTYETVFSVKGCCSSLQPYFLFFRNQECSIIPKMTEERPVVRDLVDDVIVVDDTEIIEAMKLCWEILKVVAEPSGAIGLAAVLSERFRTNPAWKDCNHIGIILSGGNVDLEVLWISYKR